MNQKFGRHWYGVIYMYNVIFRHNRVLGTMRNASIYRISNLRLPIIIHEKMSYNWFNKESKMKRETWISNAFKTLLHLFITFHHRKLLQNITKTRQQTFLTKKGRRRESPPCPIWNVPVIFTSSATTMTHKPGLLLSQIPSVPLQSKDEKSHVRTI